MIDRMGAWLERHWALAYVIGCAFAWAAFGGILALFRAANWGGQ